MAVNLVPFGVNIVGIYSSCLRIGCTDLAHIVSLQQRHAARHGALFHYDVLSQK